MINKVTLLGNLGADPDIRVQESGLKMARLRVATTERIFLKESQTIREHTEWHTVIVWRQLADLADRYLRKGSQVYIEGALRHRDWTDKDGIKHTSAEIAGSDIKLLGRRESAEKESKSATEVDENNNMPF